MVNAGHATNHLLLAELFQGLKVEIPKMLAPAPCLIILASSTVEGLCHLHMEHIKAVASLVHLGKKASTSILDAQHATLDFYL